MIAVACLIGCADTAFQQYIQNRQVAIAAMPNGRAKYAAQEQLDQQILAEKQRQHQHAVNAATNFALGMAAAAAGGSQGGRDACCPSAQGEEIQVDGQIESLRDEVRNLQDQIPPDNSNTYQLDNNGTYRLVPFH